MEEKPLNGNVTNLPEWDNLLGTAPNEEFIRELRDDYYGKFMKDLEALVRK